MSNNTNTKLKDKIGKRTKAKKLEKSKGNKKRRITIAQKIIIFLVIIILLTSFSLATYSAVIIYKNETNRVNDSLKQTNSFGENIVNKSIVQLEDLIYSIENGIRYKDRANSFVDSLMKSNPYVVSIAVKEDNGGFIAYSGGLSKAYVDALTFAEGGVRGVSWSNIVVSGDKGFIVIKAKFDNREYYVQTSVSIFQDQIDTINIEGIEVNLTDSFGTIIASTNKEQINTKINAELNGLIEQNKESNEIKIGKDSKIVFYHKFSNNFKVTSIYDKGMLNKSILESIAITIIITAIVALVITLIASVIIKKYLNAIIDINNMSKAMGKKDFTKRSSIKLDDEIGDAIRELNNSFDILKGVMKENLLLSQNLSENSTNIDDSSNSMYEISKQVSASIQNISIVAQQQAGSMVDISNNINTLGDSINDVSKTIDVLNNLYSVLSKNVENNNQGMQKLLIDNSALQSSIEDLSIDIIDISRSTKKIDDFIKIIDDIANSINLISINASIEAAHAGEVGKGFAVVAKEINKLAENSKEATDIIKVTTLDINKKISKAVDVLGETKVVSINESTSVKETVSSLKNISDEIRVMKSAIKSIIDSNNVVTSKKEEILKIVETSAASMEEVAAATEEITASTEEQFSSMEEIRSLASDLKVLAMEMKESIAEFKV
ncbi:chemotaxis sensory transducer [Clostridium sartagoforme AAU1]|uniref:Chemotaxis sensory transducer n=2 Tax=root TaxID=1 RepID=R9C7A5_9CLOT|nr:methyl-accepting chemotaxis protein [Clostridium sartagoforme]EOR25202.1 chemotaxis sensory transducer [Clostridium sartagoforme AAU1]